MTKQEESALWWEKDLLVAKESAAKTIATVNEGKGGFSMSTENIIEEAKKLIEWFYGTDDPVNPFVDNTSSETINAELDRGFQGSMDYEASPNSHQKP